MKYKITQVNPYVDECEISNIEKSINDKWLTEGPYCQQFLDKIKETTGSKYAVLAPNGTLGLFLALLALDLPKDSEVIIPSFTFYASATSVVFAGLKPVFVDVNPNTYMIDLESLEENITKNTSAIMPVHVYGHSAPITEVMQVAKKHNIRVIEDAAQAYGVFFDGKHCGIFGDVSMISFFADKTITTAEGAVVLTQCEKLYKKLRYLRNQGRDNSGVFIHPELGMNFRLNDIQCGIGVSQANKFHEISHTKNSLYNIYLNNLKGIGDLDFMSVDDSSTFVPFRFFLTTKHKEKLMEFLEHNGIQTRSYFYPMHLQPKLKCYTRDLCVESEKLYAKGICLPLHMDMTKNDVDIITDIIKEYFSEIDQ